MKEYSYFLKSVMISGERKDLPGPRISIPLILLGALLLTLPIYLNGIPKGNDLPQHLQFAGTFHESLQAGELIPSLSPSSNHGFGDVGVRFYPPVSYWVLAGLRMAVGSWHDAAVLAFALWFFLGGLGVYLWSREHFDDAGSLLAAFVYMIAPYHVNELYNASLFAEFAAAAILPFCFLFVSRVCTQPGFAGVLGVAVSYALLILTHLPTALIGSVGLVIFALLSMRPLARMRAFVALGSSVALGLLLSAFYLVKMTAELPLVNHTAAEFVERAYDFRLNFVGSYFYLPAEIYNDGSQFFGDMLGLTAAGLFVPSLLFYLLSASEESRGKLTGAVGVLLVATFFATPLSAPLWENVSLLQKIQFPYRWMVLVTLAGSFIVAAGFRHVRSAFSSKFRPLALVAAGLMFIAAAFTAAQVIRPAIYLPAPEVESSVSGLARQPSYKCWWAVWAREEAFADKQRVTIAGSSPSITQWSAYEKRFEFGTDHSSRARLGLFYYPHWTAEVNGTATELTPDEHGAVILQLPDGPANVRVFFREPAYARNAAIISAVSWLAVLALTLFFAIRNFREYVNRYSNRKPV